MVPDRVLSRTFRNFIIIIYLNSLFIWCHSSNLIFFINNSDSLLIAYTENSAPSNKFFPVS
jgi:hypothetical protein